MIFMMATFELPGTSEFIEKFLFLIGALKANTWVAALAASVLILEAE